MSLNVYFRPGEGLNFYVVKLLLVEPFLYILREPSVTAGTMAT